MKVCLPCDNRFEALDWACPRCTQAPAEKDGTLLFAPSLSRHNDGFKVEHFGELANIEANHFWFRNRNRLLTWTLRTYFPGARNFLEIGCGTGFVLSGIRKAFPNLEIAGSELFLDGLKFARNRLPGVPLYQMNATRIPFEAEFDVVGAFDVLEHIDEDEAVLSQMYQALRPGGGLMLTVPQHPALWSSADVDACHKRRYTRRELIQKVEAAGLETVRVTSFVSLLLPLMWASRRRRTASTEFQMKPMLNGFLEAALRVESWFIRRGLNLPGGGSLLLIGRKPIRQPFEGLASPATRLPCLTTPEGQTFQ
jgi:SAM-dependent methyltransferase